jgi:hypothetical protein
MGIYLHGSLVFRCCNPMQSDLDVLVVARDQLTPHTRRALDSVFGARDCHSPRRSRFSPIQLLDRGGPPLDTGCTTRRGSAGRAV